VLSSAIGMTASFFLPGSEKIINNVVLNSQIFRFVGDAGLSFLKNFVPTNLNI
jgi:hypothetical protein